MDTILLSRMSRLLPLAALLVLPACSAAQRLADVGSAPGMSPIEKVAAPQRQRSISVPIPQRDTAKFEPNSLWRTGARAFFKDQRAARVGDLLTVSINIQDSAQIGNNTARSRGFTEDTGLNSFFGLQNQIPRLFADVSNGEPGSPSAGIVNDFNPSDLVNLNSDSTYAGAGSVNRNESIQLEVAAIVTDVLPNGNLVIEGRQEVRVNFEKRELLIAGIVRPEDISSTNIVAHSRIAEARIIYGGRGQITDVQQPRYGAQLYDIIFPF